MPAERELAMERLRHETRCGTVLLQGYNASEDSKSKLVTSATAVWPSRWSSGCGYKQGRPFHEHEGISGCYGNPGPAGCGQLPVVLVRLHGSDISRRLYRRGGGRELAAEQQQLVPPIRTERHMPNSIATLRRRLIVALVRRAPRCPCCARPNAPPKRLDL
jgi:hypothetical protein